MLPLAAVCGILILLLGFLTGEPGVPPTQALTLGGMFLITVAFGKLWRLHGVGAATIVALLTVLSLGGAVWELVKTFIAAAPVPTFLYGQSLAFLIGLTYLALGTRYLLKQLKAKSPAPRF